MSRYRKISTRIWNDEKFASLTDDGKLAFFFVLTHPHMTPLGAMRATTQGLAAELGWDAGRLREAFREATAKGVLRVDEGAKCVLLPNFIKHNPPESPNVVMAWEKCLDDIPECGLKTLAIQYAISQADAMSEGFVKACGRLREAFAKSMPYQEQEQEQEQEQDKTFLAAEIETPKTEVAAATATATKKAAKPKANGARLADDWKLPKAWGEWALAEFPHWTADIVRAEAAKFADYWHAKTGKDATKRDWLATWRNWCRNAKPTIGYGGMQRKPLLTTEEKSAAAIAAFLADGSKTGEAIEGECKHV